LGTGTGGNGNGSATYYKDYDNNPKTLSQRKTSEYHLAPIAVRNALLLSRKVKLGRNTHKLYDDGHGFVLCKALSQFSTEAQGIVVCPSLMQQSNRFGYGFGAENEDPSNNM
jgi:hypothetical protein